MTPVSRLLPQVRYLLAEAATAYAGTAGEERLRVATERLDEPLRVAIAGKVKAGKSTLLNALVGEELAPTGAGEVTRIVTWYCDGPTYRVTLHPRGGDARPVRFTREDGALEVDLGSVAAADVERLVVEWPSSSLRSMTLIDTPGIASLSTEVSQRTMAFLAAGDDTPTSADAVLYLMKHLHTTDTQFLQSFQDETVSQPTPVNSVAVLSRADEVSVGRLDALESAGRIAQRYRDDPRIRRLCQTVVPVAGLLAQTGATLREIEYQAIDGLTKLDRDEFDKLLLSADRFIDAPGSAPLTPGERRELLSRFGLFGVRLACSLVRIGAVTNASELATELVRRSGLVELRQVLTTQFASRSGVLKARSALVAIEGVLADVPVAGHERLDAELERITAGAHELAELRLLNALRTGALEVRADDAEALERLVGSGGSVATRLALPPDAAPDEVRRALDAEVERWRRRAENPMSSRDAADAARVAVRTVEGLVASATD